MRTANGTCSTDWWRRYCPSWFGTTNILHIQLSQARYFSRNAFNLLVINTLGNSKLKNDKISSTRVALFVLNNFIEKRMTAKSREWTSLLFRLHASVPYNKTGKHLLATRWSNTSSEANLPTLPKMAFSERKYARLASTNEHLNMRKLFM